MRTRSRMVAGLCALALAGALPIATSAHGSASIGIGAIGASAGIGPSISTSLSAPASLGMSGGMPSGSGTLNGNSNLSSGASLNRNGVSTNAAFTAALQGTSTIRSIGAGTLTLMTSSGQALTLNLPSSVVRSLGLRVGSTVAMTRRDGQVLLTNVDTLRSMVGRAVVNRVVGGTLTFTNRTGRHTLAFAKGALQRLRLHPGSLVMVSMIGTSQVQLTSRH